MHIAFVASQRPPRWHHSREEIKSKGYREGATWAEPIDTGSTWHTKRSSSRGVTDRLQPGCRSARKISFHGVSQRGQRRRYRDWRAATSRDISAASKERSYYPIQRTNKGKADLILRLRHSVGGLVTESRQKSTRSCCPRGVPNTVEQTNGLS